jgi:hypothetical protein
MALATQGTFDLAAANAAIAESLGLRAVYNAPFAGEVGISGWGTNLFGEALTRAGGNVENVNVAYVTGRQYATGRQAAIAAEQGTVGSPQAYQYTKFAPKQFKPFGTSPRTPLNVLRGIGRGVGQAFRSTLPLMFLPTSYFEQGIPEPYRDLYRGGETSFDI